jgi:hypothetical protein
MKKTARILAILMAVMMLFTTAAISVFADGEAPAGEAPAAPAVPANVVAYPDYQSVTVKWNASPNAAKYIVTRNDGQAFETTGTEYNDTKATWTGDEGALKYTYTVTAVAADGTKSAASAPTAETSRVRTAYYYGTVKAKVTLKSHDKAKKKITLQKGEVVRSEGFRQGSFLFERDGRPYEAKWFRFKKVKADFVKNAYVNGYTAENYVNHGNFSSPTGFLIWINVYSQRVFVFQGAAGNWKLINKDELDGMDGFLCGTGKASFPTPTGMNKSLHKKMKKYSRHKWWNCFSGTNAIHNSTKKEIKKLGKMISNGCVRVTTNEAIWIFNNIPKKTRVIVF